VPGTFERWELGLTLKEKTRCYIKRAGSSDEGEPLFAIYEAGQAEVCDECRTAQ
jgi:hypothetical protein